MIFFARGQFFLLILFANFAKGNVIDSLSNLLPVPIGLHLGMSVAEFKKINQIATSILGEGALGEENENSIFGEEIGKGEIGLISEKTFYYYFINGQLARLEWKDKTGTLGALDAKTFSSHLSGVFGEPIKEKKSFFGSGSGVFEATEEIYTSPENTELRLVASKPFFSITVTDLALLDRMDKEKVFDKISDDIAIQEWNKQNGDAEILPKIANELDFLAVKSFPKERPEKPNFEEGDLEQVIPGDTRSPKKLSEKTTSQEPADKSPWPYLLGVLVALAAIFLGIKTFKGKSITSSQRNSKEHPEK